MLREPRPAWPPAPRRREEEQERGRRGRRPGPGPAGSLRPRHVAERRVDPAGDRGHAGLRAALHAVR